MGLEVKSTTKVQGSNLSMLYDGSSWVVGLNHVINKEVGFPVCIIWGFSRRKDAELALQRLKKEKIDWDGSLKYITKEWYRLGGFEYFNKICCEVLQW
jgi:hypothetical protein